MGFELMTSSLPRMRSTPELHWPLTGAEDEVRTRDPQLGSLMLYQLSYFRDYGGRRWIRTTEGISQQIYSLPHLATLVFALSFCSAKVIQFFGFAKTIDLFCKKNSIFFAFTSYFCLRLTIFIYLCYSINLVNDYGEIHRICP